MHSRYDWFLSLITEAVDDGEAMSVAFMEMATLFIGYPIPFCHQSQAYGTHYPFYPQPRSHLSPISNNCSDSE